VEVWEEGKGCLGSDRIETWHNGYGNEGYDSSFKASCLGGYWPHKQSGTS